jgi:hypothetical protein
MCRITATDLAESLAADKGWVDSSQHAASAEDFTDRNICDLWAFRRSASA